MDAAGPYVVSAAATSRRLSGPGCKTAKPVSEPQPERG